MTDSPPAWRPRDLHLPSEMSPSEALMWRVGTDPWLDPSGSMLSMLDVEPDADRLRSKLEAGLSGIPRMRERVVEPLNPLALPHWEPAPDFSIDDHFSVVELPAPGGWNELMAVTAELHGTAFDLDRPPWHFWLLTGFADGGAALMAKIHHSISDGIGGLRMAEMYLDLERDPAPTEPPPAAVTEDDEPPAPGPSLLDRLRSVAGVPVELGRSVAAEVAMIGADPLRVKDAGSRLVSSVQSALSLLMQEGRDGEPSAWRNRSGDRVVATAAIELEAAKAAARRLGGTINDLFVTATAIAGLDHHHHTHQSRPGLVMTYVRSTRQGSGAGGNSFTPTFVTPLGGDVEPEEQFRHLHDAMAASRADAGQLSMSGLSSVAVLVPTPALSKLTRDQAAKIDMATSNIKSAPFAVYIAGAKVTHTYAFGPIAGTACNATLVSYDGRLHVGLVIDPAAIPEPDGFAERVQDALDRLVADDS